MAKRKQNRQDPEELLQEIHQLMCEKFKDIIQSDEQLSPQMLNVIRQFLKDNNIDAVPAKGSPLGELIDKLPADFGGSGDDAE